MSVYVVTGGAGFVGSNLVRRLCGEGHEVRVVDDFSTGRRQNLPDVEGEVHLFEGDICDKGLPAEAFQGAECIFHQAAQVSVQQSLEDPVTTEKVNAEGTLRVLQSAERCSVPRVVFASSCAVYGGSEELPKREDMAPRPESPYAVSKLAGEHYCRLWNRLHGVETVGLRYFNVYGPRQDPESDYAAVIPAFVTAALAGETATVYGDGEQSRDFVCVDDVVEANLKAAASDEAGGRVVNVGSGEAHSLNELLDVLESAAGRRVSRNYTSPRPGDIRHSRADIGRARELLDYESAVGFAEGLRKTVEWYRGAAVGKIR